MFIFRHNYAVVLNINEVKPYLTQAHDLDTVFCYFPLLIYTGHFTKLDFRKKTCEAVSNNGLSLSFGAKKYLSTSSMMHQFLKKYSCEERMMIDQ